MKKLLALILALSLAFALTACSKPESSSQPGPEADHTVAAIKAKGKIVIATESQYAPFAFKMADGTIVGLEPKIMQAIADELGVELEIMDIEFSAVVPNVQSGAADLAMAGLNITPERLEAVDMTDVYYEGGQSIIVLASNMDKYKVKADLTGLAVGVQKASLQEQIATEQFPDAEKQSLSKIPELVNALKTGNVQAVILDKSIALQTIENNPDLAVSAIVVETDSPGLGCAVMKGNEDLKVEVSKIINKLKEEGKLATWYQEAKDLAAAENIAVD